MDESNIVNSEEDLEKENQEWREKQKIIWEKKMKKHREKKKRDRELLAELVEREIKKIDKFET